ncbi:MAG: helix-turn-helix transcriptional regulator [Nitrospirota bacterium]
MVKRGKALYMIRTVAEMLDIHPQTLRLYEREGLVKPSRSVGNTRLYSDEDVERIEFILHLTRDLGINLAGVDMILRMRDMMDKMQKEMEENMNFMLSEMAKRFTANKDKDEEKKEKKVINVVIED